VATKTAKDELSIVRTEHPNATRLREGFAAFARGDLDAVRADMAENCTWVNTGTTELAGTYTGWDQISGMFGRLFELTDGTLSMNVVAAIGDDTHAIAIYDSTSTIGGVTATNRFILIDELDASGQIVSTQNMAYDQAAADAHLNR
jgi:ketosteroid isomerase-like protein